MKVQNLDEITKYPTLKEMTYFIRKCLHYYVKYLDFNSVPGLKVCCPLLTDYVFKEYRKISKLEIEPSEELYNEVEGYIQNFTDSYEPGAMMCELNLNWGSINTSLPKGRDKVYASVKKKRVYSEDATALTDLIVDTYDTFGIMMAKSIAADKLCSGIGISRTKLSRYMIASYYFDNIGSMSYICRLEDSDIDEMIDNLVEIFNSKHPEFHISM